MKKMTPVSNTLPTSTDTVKNKSNLWSCCFCWNLEREVSVSPEKDTVDKAVANTYAIAIPKCPATPVINPIKAKNEISYISQKYRIDSLVESRDYSVSYENEKGIYDEK